MAYNPILQRFLQGYNSVHETPQRMTPEAIEEERKQAEALLASGLATSPIFHPLQGLTRMFQSLSGRQGLNHLEHARSRQRSDLFSPQPPPGTGQAPPGTGQQPPPGTGQPPPSPTSSTSIPWGQPNAPRPIRLNNPGAIEFGRFAQQHGAIGSDGRFARFETPEAGFRAMEALLSSYMGRGLVTPHQIISRWAPSSDGNNVSAYAQNVARRMGITPSTRLTLAHIPQLALAMAQHESGVNITRPSPTTSAPQSGALAPTQRRVTTLPVGPNGQPDTDGIMRLGGPREPLSAATRAGDELLAHTNVPNPSAMMGATEVGGEGLHYTPTGELPLFLEENLVAPRGMPNLLSPSSSSTGAGAPGAGAPGAGAPGAGAPGAGAPGAGAPIATGSVPEGLTDIIAQSAPANTQRIQQLEHMLSRAQTLSFEDANKLRQEYDTLVGPQRVEIPHFGNATYVYDPRQRRFTLDTFQPSPSMQNMTIGGQTIPGMYYYSRQRGWQLVRPGQSGQPGTPGTSQSDELGLGQPPPDPAGLAAWNLRLQTLTKDVEDNAAQARTIRATVGPLNERINALENLDRLLSTDNSWRGVGSQASVWLRRFASNLPESIQNLFTNTEQLGDRDLILRLTQAAGLIDQNEHGPNAGSFARAIPSIISALSLERPELAESTAGTRMWISALRAQLDRQRALARHLRSVTNIRDLRDLQGTIDRFYADNPLVMTIPASGNRPSQRVLMQMLDPDNNAEHAALITSGKVPAGTRFLLSDGSWQTIRGRRRQ